MEFTIGQQFTNPSDTRTREIIAMYRMKGNVLMLTLRCMDCQTHQKDHDIDTQAMQVKVERGIFILKTAP